MFYVFFYVRTARVSVLGLCVCVFLNHSSHHKQTDVFRGGQR